MAEPIQQQLEQLARGLTDHRTGRVDGIGAAYPQLVVIGRRDHPAHDDRDSDRRRRRQAQPAGAAPTSGARQPANWRRPHARRPRSPAVRPPRASGTAVRCRRRIRDPRTRGDHLLTAIVSVLAHLRHQDSRAPSFERLEPLDEPASTCEWHRSLSNLTLVDAADRTDLSRVAAVDLLQRAGDLAHSSVRSCSLDGQLEQVPGSVGGRPGQPLERRLAGRCVALGPQLLELRRSAPRAPPSCRSSAR